MYSHHYHQKVLSNLNSIHPNHFLPFLANAKPFLFIYLTTVTGGVSYEGYEGQKRKGRSTTGHHHHNCIIITTTIIVIIIVITIIVIITTIIIIKKEKVAMVLIQ